MFNLKHNVLITCLVYKHQGRISVFFWKTVIFLLIGEKPLFCIFYFFWHLGSSEPSNSFQHHEQHAHCAKVKANTRNAHPRGNNLQCKVCDQYFAAPSKLKKNIFVFVCLFTGIYSCSIYFLIIYPFLFCILPQSYIPPVLGQQEEVH